LFKDFIDNFTDRLLRSALARVGFWSDGMHDFDIIDGAICLGSTVGSGSQAKKWVVIVSREHYFETATEYPIGIKRDVRSALRNQPWRFPYEGTHLYRVRRLTSSSHRVTSWVIKQEIIDRLPSSLWFVLPESVCGGFLPIDTLHSYQRFDHTLHLIQTFDGLRSSLGQREAFLREISFDGGRGSMSETLISPLEVPKMLVEGAIRAVKADPRSFFVPPGNKSLNDFPWKSLGKLSGALVVTYLALSSLLIWSGNAWLDHRVALTSRLAENPLTVRAALEADQQRLSEVEGIFDDVDPLWVTWDLFLDMTERGVVFRGVNADSTGVTFLAVADKASDVLAFLKGDKRILVAQFIGPIRSVMSSEQFAIKVTLKEPERAVQGIQEPLGGSVETEIDDVLRDES
jgi:hypothetical protein